MTSQEIRRQALTRPTGVEHPAVASLRIRLFAATPPREARALFAAERSPQHSAENAARISSVVARLPYLRGLVELGSKHNHGNDTGRRTGNGTRPKFVRALRAQVIDSARLPLRLVEPEQVAD